MPTSTEIIGNIRQFLESFGNVEKLFLMHFWKEKESLLKLSEKKIIRIITFELFYIPNFYFFLP